jgi:glycosyltransferase involved in cell wall biosynthesis
MLREAIESVLVQTFTDFEIVVSDDSGRLEPIARAFDDSRVLYHANPRPAGAVANMRRALSLARGRLVGLLDDDDLWLPEFLATVVDRFERDPDLGVVFTDLYLDAAGRRVARRPPLAAGRQESFLHQLLEHCPVSMSSSLMRREVWERGERDFPLLDGTVGDGIWIRAAAAAWPFHYVDRPLAVYRWHAAGQLSESEDNPARIAATFERFRFDDPVCERLRRARLAEARLAQAGVHLRHGRLRSARFDVARARQAAPGRLGVRALIALTGAHRLGMRWAAAHPRLLTMGLPVWRRVRPAVVPETRVRP